MSQPITIKNFVHITEKDSIDNNPASLRIYFNSTELTSSNKNMMSKTYMTPLYLSINWYCQNVCELYKNNRFTIKVGTQNPVTVVIPDDYYTGITLQTALLAAIVTANPLWAVAGASVDFSGSTFNPNNSRFFFKVAQPVSAIAGSPSIVLDFKGVSGYDSSDVFGISKDANGEYKLTITYPTSATGSIKSGGESCDLQKVENLRVHSNAAKSTYIKKNNIMAATDILLNLPTYNVQSGSIFTFQPTEPSIYKQEINDTDYLTLYFTDNEDRLIPFTDNVEINFSYILERQLIPQTAQERINSVQNYIQWS